MAVQIQGGACKSFLSQNIAPFLSQLDFRQHELYSGLYNKKYVTAFIYLQRLQIYKFTSMYVRKYNLPLNPGIGKIPLNTDDPNKQQFEVDKSIIIHIDVNPITHWNFMMLKFEKNYVEGIPKSRRKENIRYVITSLTNPACHKILQK